MECACIYTFLVCFTILLYNVITSVAASLFLMKPMVSSSIFEMPFCSRHGLFSPFRGACPCQPYLLLYIRFELRPLRPFQAFSHSLRFDH